MDRDKIDELLHDIDKAGFGLPFSMIPEEKKAAFTKALSLGYLDIDPANNYCLSRIGSLIVNSGLSYKEWEAINSKPDGTGRLDDKVDPLSPTSQNTNSDIEIPTPAAEEKPAKKSWLSIFGLK
jgi:hypothetical protein